VYCSDSTYAKIYAGGAIEYQGLRQGSPRGISVYTGSEQRYGLPDTYTGGGTQSTASGSFTMESGKLNYRTGDPIVVKWSYSSLPAAFGTVVSAWFYRDESQLADFDKLEEIPPQQIGPSRPHYFQFSYDEDGDWQPSIKLINGSGSTIQFWLGGYLTESQGEWITTRGFAPIGQFTESTSSGSGIFGLPASAFQISFGDNPGLLLSGAQYALNQLVGTFVYLSGLAFNLVKATPIFNDVFFIMHPPAGRCYSIPQTLFSAGGYTIDLPDEMSSYRSYCIAYADSVQFGFMYMFLVIGIMVMVFRYVFFKLF